MKAFFADKALYRPVVPPLHVRSRDMALALALGNEDQLTVHEQAVDPMIYRAASELIRLDDEGTKTNIEAQGQVFDVLQTIEEQLAEVGASRFAASQILDSLKFYVSGLGADFARQAKAKPLYARVMVTDKEPTDMPDCKLSSLTCIDGSRIQGDDAGKMSMTLTLYGTSNAMSQGMSMQRVFESGKKKWVMVYYGTIEGADLNKFDTVDADLATLIQAVGAGGGASVEEIRAAIENGTLAPEVKQLIAAIAALNRTVEAARTPGAIENPEAKIAELKATIAEIMQTIPDMQALPQVLLQAVAESIAPVEISPDAPDVAVPAEASNDNDTVLEQTGSVLEQLTALLQDEALPPEMKEALTVIVEKMDAAMATKDLPALQATMVEVRGTLTEFAASEAIPAQMFRTLSEILPAVVVAEKQLGDAAPRPVTAESLPDTANLELADNVADIELLLAEKIDVLLKDEALPPEIKEQLVKIVQSMESAIDQKDFAKLVIATTEIRQTLADLAANETLPPQITKQLGDILPSIAASEQKLADVVPRAQAENILAALISADEKLQAGTIAPTPEIIQLAQALDALKDTIKEQGPEAALQKIVESLKAPTAETAIVPVLDILAKNPALLESLPPELGQALAQAVAPAERSIQQHLAVAGIASDIPKAAPEKIIDVLLAVESRIDLTDIKVDPAKAELAKIIADLKQTIDKDGMSAAVQKITEALQQVSVDGKASPILEIIAGQPALLAALPIEMQASVQQLKESSILINAVVTQQAEKIVDVVAIIDQQIKTGEIDKADPANAELVKVIADIKDTIKQEGLPAAAEKIAEALKTVSVDGKVPPIIEVLASQPALLAALPQDLQRSVNQIHKTALAVSVPVERQAERIVDVVAILDQKIQSGAIDRADPANAELIKIVADIQKSIQDGGSPAAVEKITEALKQVGIDGKVPPIIEALVAHPALLDGLPTQIRGSIEQIHQAAVVAAIPAKQAQLVVEAVQAIDRDIQNGTIDKTSPANAELVQAIAEIKESIKQGGTAAAVEKITEALKQVSIDGKAPPIIAAIAAQPAILASLPQDIRGSVERIQQTAILIAAPVRQQALQIAEVVTALDQKIQSGAISKADPVNAELVRIVADIKETAKVHGNTAVIEKITEALQQIPAGGKAPPIVEVLLNNPTLLATLPRDVQLTVVQVQNTASAAFVPIRQQAEKIVQVVEILQQGIQSGAIDKSNPATAILIKAVSDIRETIGTEGASVAIQKFNDVLQKGAIDGKAPPIVEILTRNPDLAASLPLEAQRVVREFQNTAALTAAPMRDSAERIADIIKSIDAKIQTGAISKADPANAVLINAVAEMKVTMLQGGTPAVVQKISDGLALAAVTGKVPAIVQAAMQQPTIYASLPPQDRAALQNIQQRILSAPVPVERQAQNIMQAVVAVERQIRRGEIDASSPANAEAIKVITDMKVAMQQGATRDVVRGLENSIKAGDPRAVEIASALGHVAKNLPAPLQKAVMDVQRSTFSAEAANATLKQQVVIITPQQKSEFQAAIKNSNLSPTESAKYLNQIQGGQASVETVRQIVQRVEATSPAADVPKLRRELATMETKAVAAANTAVSVKIDPIVEKRVISAVAKLPVSASTLEQVKSGPITKVALANIIMAAGTAPPREVRHYIQEATKQVLKQESRTVVAALRNNPLPHIPPRMVQDMKDGRPISAAQIQRVIENPKTPQVTRQALERYVAVQNQVAPYVSPAALKAELKQIQKILTATNPAVARAIETFVQKNPTARPEVFKDYVRSMPEQARVAVENAAARIQPRTEPHFRPSDPKEFIAIVERAAASASPQERVFIRELVDKARMGEPIPRSDMDHLTQVTKMSTDVHVRVAANMVPAEEKSVIEGICAVCSHKNCGACKDAHLAAYEEHQKKEANGLLLGSAATRPEPNLFR